MTRATGSIGVLIALFSLALSSPVRACACCAEPGEIQHEQMAVDEYLRGELQSIRFARSAHLFMTAAGWDTIEGIASLGQVDVFRLVAEQNGNEWKLRFVSDPTNTGALYFTLPSRIELYAVDSEPQPGHATTLRKEWRLEFPIRGNGMFGKGLETGDPQGRLVLHGIGNACTDATQFGYWTLDVRGSQARFRLYGKLKAPGS